MRSGRAFSGSRERRLHWPFHVRLAAGNPNFAYDNIGQRDGILSRHLEGGWLARFKLFQSHHPFSVLGRSADRLIAELHGDGFAIVSPPPVRYGHAPLQNHVVTEEPMETNVRLGRGNEQSERER